MPILWISLVSQEVRWQPLPERVIITAQNYVRPACWRGSRPGIRGGKIMTLRCALLLGLIAGLAGNRALAQDLPKADDIMEKYITATGGKEARLKIKNRVSKGTVELAGIKGKITIYQAEPNLMYTVMEME